MEAFLRALLPRCLPAEVTFNIHVFQGKFDLLKHLENRLRGYASWIPPHWRIIVVLDCDDDDCYQLKAKMEKCAENAGLRTRSHGLKSNWHVVNRIAVEELEAWYFGDWEAVIAAYPRVPKRVVQQTKYRNPDKIAGGTWQAFERVLQRHGYFAGGLPKIEVARAVGGRYDPRRSRSPSFAVFHTAVLEAAGCRF